MPLALITIEQRQQQWVAEVEMGTRIGRRKRLVAPDFDAIVSAVTDTYHEFDPQPKPVPPAVPEQVLVAPPIANPTMVPAQRRAARGSQGSPR
jgi:hypothetical protein